MMPPYSVLCYTKGCGRPASFKVAARWSDGLTEELKTYALSCPHCVADWLRRSRDKQAACRRAPGEVLDPPGIFEWSAGRRDRILTRRNDLEDQAATPL